MTINMARTAVAVALALSTGVALADGFQKGFYIGATTGASFVTGQTIDKSVIDDTSNFSREEASARGYNAGVLLGWDFYSDNEYIYGLVASGNAYTNRAHQTWSVPNRDGEVYQNSWKMNYSADLSFKPGWFVSDSTELFALMGGSIAQIDTEVKNFGLVSDGYTHGKNKTLYGFVLGMGVQKQLCNRLSVVASYQYTYYGKTRVATVDYTDEAPNFVSNKLRVDTNVAKIGLVYTF